MTADATQVWDDTANVLVQQVSDAVWSSTFQDVRGKEFVDGVLTLSVPSQMVRQRIEQRYLGLMEASLADAGHGSISLVIEVEIDDFQPEPDVPRPAAPSSGGTESSSTASSDPTPDGAPSDSGNRRYTFESFVTGPSNRFAHAAALSVAETPARSYNPLFVYGGAGLGKTHLLQSISHYVRENYPTYRVRYISTETLLNEFVDAIRKNSQPEFKRRYREIDVLLVDDIQFIEGKEQLQEEFFHTFNTLHEAQRQIVLSSDRPPDAIATLEDRLRSRFKMGLITDIQPPDFETPPGDPPQEGRARRLPGALRRARVHRDEHHVQHPRARGSTHPRQRLRRAQRRRAVRRSGRRDPRRLHQLHEAATDHRRRSSLEQTAEMFGLDVEQLRGKSRTRDLVHARQVGMYVCRALTDLSYPQIGKEFGGRDHTTVIHAYEKIANLMKERRKTYEDVTALEALIQQHATG